MTPTDPSRFDARAFAQAIVSFDSIQVQFLSPSGSFYGANPYIQEPPDMAIAFDIGAPDPDPAPPPKPELGPVPTCRIILSTGAEFQIEVKEFDIRYNYSTGVLGGHRLSVSGAIITPTPLPAFAIPETERAIHV
jgi:hypothetical protein